jgi:hypothetical protein
MPDREKRLAARLRSIESVSGTSTEPIRPMPELTAYHEAGHAWMAVLTGARVLSVTIAPDWDDGPDRYGDTQVAWQLSQFTDRELAEKGVRVSLAGPVAEMTYNGKPYHPGLVAEWADDWQSAWQGAAALLTSERRRLQYLEQQTAELRQLLEQANHWAALAEIADQLLAHERLEGEVVTQCVRQWL